MPININLELMIEISSYFLLTHSRTRRPTILVQSYGTERHIPSPMYESDKMVNTVEAGLPVASCATNLILSLGQDSITR